MALKPRLVLVTEAIQMRGNATREIYWDIVRGVAITLVFLGHAIQTMVPKFDDNWAFRIIYSFHMPLFMFVSGILGAKTFSGSLPAIGRRFVALALPFLSWAVLQFGVTSWQWHADHLVPDWRFFARLAWAPGNGLWFLWVLFLCLVLLAVVKRSGRWGISVAVGLYFGLSAFDGWRGHGIFGLNLLIWQLPYFLAGYFVSPWKDLTHGQKHLAGLGSMVVFLLLVPYWHRMDAPGFYGAFGWGHQPWLTTLYQQLTAFAGIGCVFYLVSLTQEQLRWFAYPGAFSLELYAVQIFSFGWAQCLIEGTSWIAVGLCFAISVMTAVLLIAAVKQSQGLNLLLFGRRMVRPAYNSR